ncbi:MAG: c-type cytochrome, partial [Pirellulaceae bacterium]|nr:c-type cytochrome [Pirellulaceae bacterium]
VAMQTLSLPDGDRRRRVETRLLTKQQGEWAAYTYLWNEDQTDAVLAPALGSRVTLADRVWRAPSRVECMSCHSRANNYLLGLTPAQFNTVHDYGEFRAEQYEVLAQVGWTSIDWLKDARQEWRAKLSAAGVTGDRLDATLKRLTPRGGQRPVPRSTLLHTSSRAGDLLADPWDQSASLDRRARSYLHANCAHCHVLDGGGNSRFVVSWGTTGDDMKLADVKGIHGEFGLPDGLLVKPGDAESSLLAYRLQSLGGGRMPRVGSHEVDAAGVRLIRAWIDSLGSADASGQRRAATAVELKDGERRDKLIVEELKSTNGAMRLARLVDDAQVDEGTRRKIVDAALQHERPGVRDLFEQFIPSTQRVERLGVSFDPRRVLDLLGDARRGRRLFLQGDSISCKNCHRVEEQGRMVGPNLDKIGKRFKRAKVLESIVAPSLLVDEKFAAYSALTADGRVVAGLMVERTDEFIVLRDPTGRDTKIAQEDVEEIRRQQKSLMPDHLIKDLTAQQAADLLAYLMELE